MRVRVTRVDKSLPLPKYLTEGSVAFDMYSRKDVTVPPKGVAKVPLNLIIKVPKGYALLIFPRSSLFLKKGLLMANSVGIIDQDYCGEEDEICALLYNPGNNEVAIRRGERIAQGLLVKIERAEFYEGKAEKESRGGFGSTGGYS